MRTYETTLAGSELVVTDGGLETWLLFERGIDLPAFAAYPLVGTDEGREVLRAYYRHYLEVADRHGLPLQLETPTWRANPDWAATLGHDLDPLADLLSASVALVRQLGEERRAAQPLLVGGAVGPRGDGYVVGETMTADAAAEYHAFQARRLAEAGADVLTAMTIGYVEEAVGIALAARDAGLPVVVSFTVETDGRLPSGTTLREAVEATDAATGSYAATYMVNCAHPTHFADVLEAGGAWTERIGGVRANASAASHAELDEATELDSGDPDDLADRYVGLRSALPSLRLVGGCCGTDHRHVGAVVDALHQPVGA